MPCYTLVTPYLTLADWHSFISKKLAQALPYPQLLAKLCQWDVLPMADISAYTHGLDLKRHWLKATPITLNLGHGAAASSINLTLSAEEIQQLAVDLNALVQDYGLEFYVCQHELLLASHPELDIHTTPVHSLAGQNIFPYLPKGKKAQYWLKLFTEIQMICHQHPINQARSENAQPTLDALWLWGEGKLPATKTMVPWDAIYADVLWPKDLANYLNLPFQLLQDPPAVLASHCLIIIESTAQLAVYPSLLKTLLAKKNPKITLYPSDGYCYDLQQRNSSLWQKLMALLHG